jgi:hypothetical protein
MLTEIEIFVTLNYIKQNRPLSSYHAKQWCNKIAVSIMSGNYLHQINHKTQLRSNSDPLHLQYHGTNFIGSSYEQFLTQIHGQADLFREAG